MSENLEKIRKVKQKYEKTWMALDEVVAVGIGLTAGGKPGIIVSLKSNLAQVKQKIPAEVEGVAVEFQVTGEIVAR